MKTSIECRSEAAATQIWRLVSQRLQVIVPLKVDLAGIPLYCVHSIGGDLAGYDKIANELGQHCPVYGIQATKNEMSSSNMSTIEDLSASYVGEINRIQPTGPLMLSGYSAGAVIALEIAQQLRCQGRDVPLLIAFDGAPSNIDGLLRPWQALYIFRLICSLPWRMLCFRIKDITTSEIKRRREFKKVLLGGGDIRSQSTIDSDAICAVMGRDGWSKEQQRFMVNLHSAIMQYVPAKYDGAVILYEVKAQPFPKLLQLSAAWRLISPNCEVIGVSFTRHSDFFRPSFGLQRVIKHMCAAIRQVYLSQRRSLNGIN